MKYQFHGKYKESDKQRFTTAQKNDLEKICNYLKTDLSVAKDFQYKIYDTRKKKQESDPYHSISKVSARFNKLTIYRFWETKEDPNFPHELTHLIAHMWHKPYVWETSLDTWDRQKITQKNRNDFNFFYVRRFSNSGR